MGNQCQRIIRLTIKLRAKLRDSELCFLLEIVDTEESDQDSTCYINMIIANILFEPEGGCCFEEHLRMD